MSPESLKLGWLRNSIVFAPSADVTITYHFALTLLGA
jgi:hypothetical protein